MRTPIPVLITAFFWALAFSPLLACGHALNLGVVLLATAAGSTPLTPRKKAPRAPKPKPPSGGGKNASHTAPEEGFVANTTATTKRFTGPKTAARLALALLQGCVLAPRSCAYTFRSITQSIKKKLGREGVTFSEEGVHDFITV